VIWPPIANKTAKVETKIDSRLSRLRRVALACSRPCLASNLASRSRSEFLIVGDLVNWLQLSVDGVLDEFTKFSKLFLILLAL
jgi:hypothetical protein